MASAITPPPNEPRSGGRFWREPLALVGIVINLMAVLAALTAPWLAPYPPDEQFFDGLTAERDAAEVFERIAAGSIEEAELTSWLEGNAVRRD